MQTSRLSSRLSECKKRRGDRLSYGYRQHLVSTAHFVDNLDAVDHATEYGVLTVEMRLGGVADEELAAAGIRPSVSHR